jgi:hypothetical protein
MIWCSGWCAGSKRVDLQVCSKIAGIYVVRIFGIDFTSSPTPRKPLTCLPCWLEDGVLRAKSLQRWSDFKEFEYALRAPGPWIAGIDFPFGQSRRFIENIGWPMTWNGYLKHVAELSRDDFRQVLTVYRSTRAFGDKEHRRETDSRAGSLSPQKLHGVPVALMFFEGARRLLEADVTVPGLNVGDPNRIVVEAYPKILARKFGGGKTYKNDAKTKQTEAQYLVREEIFKKITNRACEPDYGLLVEAPVSLVADPSGDELDALLCAVQAAWSWTKREENYGAPRSFDSLEGWIADPSLCT